VRISFYCTECLARLDAPPANGGTEGAAACPAGHPPVAFHHTAAVAAGTGVDRCSRCEGAAFFVQKDFDQRLGCAILAAGALAALLLARFLGGVFFVPVLLVFTVADLVLARRVPPVVICYRCDTEYRGVPGAAARHRPYDPHVAERYADVKTVRRMAGGGDHSRR